MDVTLADQLFNIILLRLLLLSVLQTATGRTENSGLWSHRFSVTLMITVLCLKMLENEEKKKLSVPFWMPAETKILVLLSASVKRFGVSRMQD